MRVLFDITHPADVHLFRYVLESMRARGHEVFCASREKDVTVDLLDTLGVEHSCLSRAGRGLMRMGTELVARVARLIKMARKCRADVIVARIGVSAGPAGAVLRIPRVVLEDTEHAKLQLALSMPFATRILTGTGYLKEFGKRQHRFKGTAIQAYLDPNYYTPNLDPVRDAGVDPEACNIVMRLVSWEAAHDVGVSGAGDEDLVDAIDRLSRFGRVIISSEKPLHERLKKYENPVPSRFMHDLLACADLCVSEGATTAAEAATLGVPTVYCNPLQVGFLKALDEEYGLAHRFDSLPEGLKLAESWLEEGLPTEEWTQRRERLLDESEDVVGFLCEQIETAVAGPKA